MGMINKCKHKAQVIKSFKEKYIKCEKVVCETCGKVIRIIQKI